MQILILFPKLYWETKMSSGRRDVILWLIEHAGAGLSGQGWSDWRNDLPMRENIQRVMPDAEAVIWYKPEGSQREGIPPILEPKDRSIPAVAIYNEAWWGDSRAANECRAVGTDLVIHHHQNDSDKFGDVSAIHIPHCADPRIFASAARAWEERTVPLLVTGVLSRDIYPLRCRVAELIRSGRLPGEVLPHPGYRLPGMAECRAQQKRYAAKLGQAKVVICCSSVYRYFLAKFTEAAMAGAIVAGDEPDDDEFRRVFARGYVTLDMSMSDDELVSLLGREYPQCCDLQLRAMKELNIGRYCERLTDAIQTWIATGEFQAR